MHRPVLFAAVIALGLADAGCVVYKRDYDQVVKAAAQAKVASDAKARDQDARIAELTQQLAAAEAGSQERDAKISDLSTGVHNIQAQLDEATAINQELRAALERMGKDADKLLAERGTLSRSLEDAKSRLEELRRAQAAADARVTLFRDFEQRFEALIRANQMRVESRHNHLVMDLAGDLLFEPNHSDLRPSGKGMLMEIAHAIATTSAPATGRRFLVTDHVDEEPGKGKRARSSWDLSAARGVAVVEYMVSVGVAPESLTAAGAGSFDPLGPNDTADHRAKNRRVEIALLPAADSAPAAPVAAVATPATAAPLPSPTAKPK